MRLKRALVRVRRVVLGVDPHLSCAEVLTG